MYVQYVFTFHLISSLLRFAIVGWNCSVQVEEGHRRFLRKSAFFAAAVGVSNFATATRR
jgi:hypothetical protein